jgi:Sigma-54 interaction domain
VAPPIADEAVATAAEGFEFNVLTDATLLLWLTARGHRPNVLVEASRGSADTVVRHLMTWCALPFRFSSLPGTLELPAIRRGTLLLKDVATLRLAQQVELYDWLTAGCGGMEVVSVTTAPLQALVEDGEFLEGLFYRLNVLRLDAKRGTRPAPLSAWRGSHETRA